MAHVTYRIVEHDGGWAYKLGDVFSETFRSRDAAVKAAHRVAQSSACTATRTPSNTKTPTGNGTRSSRAATTGRMRMWRNSRLRCENSRPADQSRVRFCCIVSEAPASVK